ncbi:DUF4933 domain-containing protein [Maribellus maritimus]|uniref:DUF4933 domain-containing protein n=1 Tax=Maribellus maritimus TaxID=2870838 RepID=UPI001EECBF1C|nr:DUF4933 domain-containing protein [Maribellus maritimus]MCG6189815.1 DUF4933 domain-containing protein [Maribellus maritimus]
MKSATFIFVLLFLVACKPRNKLNTNEQKLAAEIKTEEQEKKKAEKATEANSITIPDSLPPGFRFQEDRKIDPENPPEMIDIVGNLNNKKEIKLSDITKRVRYIRLAPPPDSIFYQTPLQIIFTQSNIIATSHFGTCIYSLTGEFIDLVGVTKFDSPNGIPPPPIPKNDPYFAKFNDAPEKIKSIRKKQYGFTSKEISGIYENNFSGDDIFFKYRDRDKEESYLMKYNVKNQSNSLPLPNNKETKDLVIFKGDKIVSLTDKSTFNYHILSKNSKIGYQRKWNSAQNGIMLLLENMQGDTLCIFKEYDRIKNYDATLVRSVESGSQYFYKNQFTYRSAFNDTVFRLIPPNRLLPAFLLNFGEHKLTALEAIHPNYDLANKFLINSWTETPDYIFIRYTKDRSTINSRVNKTVKYHYAVYDKKLKQTIHLPVDPLNYAYEIENNIDGGLPVWPELITQEGKIYKVFEGWELKKHVQSKEFLQLEISAEKKEFLTQLAEAASDAETIIMILE